MIIERLVEDKHLSRIILYLDLAWFEIMEYVYYLTTLCLPVLLFLIALKLTGSTNMWWKVFLTAFGLNVIFLFAWTDFVTKPLCSLFGCSQPDETTIVGCFQDAFFHAALTEELEKVVGACLILFLVFRKHRINADGVFKATLASGTNFGLVETLGKVRYNVIQSGVKDYVWDSSSYHISALHSLLRSETVHFLLAVIMACFLVKALRTAGRERLVNIFAAVILPMALHFINNFYVALKSMLNIGIVWHNTIIYGFLIILILLAYCLWKNTMKTPNYQLQEPRSV